MNKPSTKPNHIQFSSGPCRKYSTFSFEKNINSLYLSRSQRSQLVKDKLEELITRTKKILEIPDNYNVGLVSGSDTGAIEMSLWNLLGPLPIKILDWCPFSRKWAHNIVNELKLTDVNIHQLPIGTTPNANDLVYSGLEDLVFTWNITGTGYCVNDSNWIPNDRTGLTICDATSIVFAQKMPWSKLDVTTFSWQKVLGGEAGIGVVVMSPNAINRLNTYHPPWPIPNLYTIKNKQHEIKYNFFVNYPINTLSMMTIIDYECALDWTEQHGGVEGLTQKSLKNKNIIKKFVDKHHWINY